ncbi:MAG: exo-beta-N-acetylmuramidase NamZ domain-containing protein [Oligoflexales bacterium]
MAQAAKSLQLGLERIAKNPKLKDDWGRVGLLCNQASLTHNFEHAHSIMQRLLGSNFKALFGPQHGIEATLQDNMIESPHETDRTTRVPVYSLYSETREPTEEMLASVDTIVIDLQITGCRVYTFKYTMAACLRAAKKYGKRVVILDRPNPLGGVAIDGRVLETDAKSFVGEFAIPMRHGLTLGEAARLFNAQIKADLSIVSMENWNPQAMWHELGRHWTLTSPNVPTVESIYIYPATVLIEGTNISEGRGTGLPFQFIGAPYISDSRQLVERVMKYVGEDCGVFLRPTSFQPTFQKWAGKACAGFQIHILDPHKLRLLDLGIAIVRSFIDLGGSDFAWKQPPYEYDYVNNPINLVMGTFLAERQFTAPHFDVHDKFWKQGLKEYGESVREYLLYPREMRPS